METKITTLLKNEAKDRRRWAKQLETKVPIVAHGHNMVANFCEGIVLKIKTGQITIVEEK